jgi:hypothetical protein
MHREGAKSSIHHLPLLLSLPSEEPRLSDDGSKDSASFATGRRREERARAEGGGREGRREGDEGSISARSCSCDPLGSRIR